MAWVGLNTGRCCKAVDRKANMDVWSFYIWAMDLVKVRQGQVARPLLAAPAASGLRQQASWHNSSQGKEAADLIHAHIQGVMCLPVNLKFDLWGGQLESTPVCTGLH